MTVSTTSIKAGPYSGNDVATAFAYTWRIESKTEVIVYETDDSDVVTTLTVDTDYTVANIGVDGGGDITRVAGALPTGYTWLIVSNFAETQETDFESQGAFLPAVHEAAFDKLTHLVQQLSEVQGRSLTLSQTSTGVSVTLPDPVAGYLIGWNDTADALATLASADSIVVVQATEPDHTVFKLWYDTSTSNLKFWDGTVWQSTSGTDITGKADKVTGATSGDLATLDTSGNLTDSGVPASTVLVDGDIGTTVQGYSAANGAFGSALLHVQDQKPSGTNGGIALAGVYSTRDLNQVLTNEISGASLNSSTGVITLPAGTYYAEVSAPAYRVFNHRVRLRSTTATLLLGTSEYMANSTSALTQSHSQLSGRFTLSATTDVHIEHHVGNASGTSVNFGVSASTGEVEVYTNARFWKIV